MSYYDYDEYEDEYAGTYAHDVEGYSDDDIDTMPGTSDGKKRVHNLIILDQSGSMASIYRPALTGAMFATERRSRKNFFDKLSNNMDICKLSVGYFNVDDDDDDDKNNMY